MCYRVIKLKNQLLGELLECNTNLKKLEIILLKQLANFPEREIWV
ncbi:hypothetical protein NIES2107_42470 [Nostoc carneum NIES-2107]|nr:hypothetical protein NIES2107_42470 [Nostoc carneum NIES-2107]